MASAIQYTCDHCQRPRGDANHWFCLRVSLTSMQVWTWSAGVNKPGVLHLCGEECLHAEVSSAIAAGRSQQGFRQRPPAEQVQFESVELRESA